MQYLEQFGPLNAVRMRREDQNPEKGNGRGRGKFKVSINLITLIRRDSAQTLGFMLRRILLRERPQGLSSPGEHPQVLV